MAWIENLSQRFLDSQLNPGSYVSYFALVDSMGKVVSANYKMQRSPFIGIVKAENTTNAYVYVWLYKATYNDTINPVTYPGYYYRFNHKNADAKMYKYNSTPYGTKPSYEVIKSQPGVVGGGQGYTPPGMGTTVSASTSSTFGNSSIPARDTLTSWMQAIAGRPYMGDFRVSSFAQKAEASLIAKGYTRLEAQAYLKAKDDTERGYVKKYADDRIKAALDKLFGGNNTGGAGGSGNGSSSSSNGANSSANYVPISFPDVQTKLVVRMPGGFQIPNQSVLNAITSPALNQTFIDETGKVQSYTYQFDFVPGNIQYSGLSSEWVEIPRAENFPFVDWNRYQLMKVSMSWIMALDRTETGGATVHDGMFNSVDSRILDLRRMSQRKYPVSIVNMDDLLSVKLITDYRNGSLRSVSGMQFVITDLSITASRRTSDPSTGQPTTPSKIAVAQCQMTLQEVPIESVQIVSLPKLNIPFTPPGKAPKTNPFAPPEYDLASKVQVQSPDTSWATDPPGSG